MTEKTYTEKVAEELSRCLLTIDETQIRKMADEITPDVPVFCDGAGRSRLQIQGFAMRLVQMGFRSAIVGDPIVPAITSNAVLLICSASGETPTMVAHAKKAKAIGARVMLITAAPSSSLVSICDEMILIHASSKLQISNASIQPMGSLFEQSVGILCDILVLHLMERYQITNHEMYTNHANLE